VRGFVHAVQAGDAQAVQARLGPRTRGRFVTAQGLGGAPRWQPVKIRELSRTGERALVELTGPGGELQEVRTVRDHGRWYVELQ
jgi:hypothetical protein